ncbi:MAG TPA: SMC-Scp complex subunit ScpB [Candidatus Angelobacter sp.]|jgi:segregation and condensation protein B
MRIKAQLEALIYAAEDPITLDQMAALLKADLLALKTALPEAASEVLPQEDQLQEPQLQENQPLEFQSEASPDSSEQPSPEQTAEQVAEHAEDHLGAVEDTNTQAVVQATEPRAKKTKEKSEKSELRALLRPYLEELIADYTNPEHGIEIREVASGYRMSTKPEHHDVVRGFSKSLKPPIRLSLQALETLAVIAYKQPVTVPEISDIRGVDAAGVIGTLLERKLITTAGRKAVVGRPMLYKTTKDFLMRFGLRDINELPSLEEFEKLAAGEMQDELFPASEGAVPDATGTPGDESEDGDSGQNEDGGVEQMSEDKAEVPQNVTEPTVSSDPEHNKADEQVADQIASESSGG